MPPAIANADLAPSSALRLRRSIAGPPPRLAADPGDQILVPLDMLRPTQVAVGMKAVAHKRRKLETRAVKQRHLDKFLDRRPIPSVRGPDGDLFMIDHHHLGVALWQARIAHAYVRIVADLSELPRPLFWRRMEAEGRLYPFDEAGDRVPVSRLPRRLGSLRHDLFRDLAWSVREAGGFEKSAEPYAEFRWAEFFRQHIPRGALVRNYDETVAKARRLARTRDAADLPGFIAR